MKVHSILFSALALSLLALGINMGTAHASTAYAHPYNALNSYIKMGHFHMVNNANYSRPASYSSTINHDGGYPRRVTMAGGNHRLSFHSYAKLGESNNSQSSVILPNGNLYVGYYDGPNRHNVPTYMHIDRYNINDTSTDDNGDRVLNVEKRGPVLPCGKGQAMAWDARTKTLWLDKGPENKVTLYRINPKTLRPQGQLNFGFEPYGFGGILAFDNHGNAYNAIDTFHTAKGGPQMNSLKLYRGSITRHNAHFHMVQGLRHDPGAIMQNMGFNPSNGRVYFVADGNITSVPANKIGRNLRPKDIYSTKLGGHYEPEDITFYRNHAYLLNLDPSQLLISDQVSKSSHSYRVRSHKRVIRHKSHNRRRNHRSYVKRHHSKRYIMRLRK